MSIRPIRRAVACSGQARCRLLMPGLRFDDKLSLELTMPSTVPGRGLSASLPRHFVPGYYRAVPPGQKDKNHSPIEAPRIKPALMGLSSSTPSASGNKTSQNHLNFAPFNPGLRFLAPSASEA